MSITAEDILCNSKFVGCMVRGLPLTAAVQGNDEFKYINCLDREYLDQPQNINSVTFDISRYGQYFHTLEFSSPVSEKIAIEKVEEYLSAPLTEDYYNNIADDLFHGLPWEEAKEEFTCRGECLTDCKFLERTYIDNGNLTFSMGS